MNKIVKQGRRWTESWRDSVTRFSNLNLIKISSSKMEFANERDRKYQIYQKRYSGKFLADLDPDPNPQHWFTM